MACCDTRSREGSLSNGEIVLGVRNIRGLNLAAVMCMTVQVPRLSF
jgi:hypothetical protein